MTMIQYTQPQIDNATFILSNKLGNLIGNNPQDWDVVTVIEGGSYLAARSLLNQSINTLRNIRTYSIKVSSYKGKKRGEIKFDYEPYANWEGRNVIIIDDFCDSGNTVNKLNEYFKKRGAKRVVFLTLLARASRRVDEDIELYYGIEDNTENFYVGCGLDDNDRARWVDNIYY